MKYVSITVETTTEASDIVSLILMEEGSDGTSIIDSSDIDFAKKNVYWDYAPKYVNDKNVLVTGVFEQNFDTKIIKNRLQEFKKISEINVGSLSLEVRQISNKDYENEWKKYYDITLYDNLAIVPDWLSYKGDKPALKLCPKGAFGTGAHESTAMCLSLMQKLDFVDKVVLDVGCGSGILGLSAAKMGAKKVFMTDIDSQAITEAITNATNNGLTHLVEIKQQSFAKGVKSDILLANLTADLLINLLPRVNTLLKSGGFLIISGIINQRAEDVRQAFSDYNLVENIKSGEWQAFLYSI